MNISQNDTEIYYFICFRLILFYCLHKILELITSNPVPNFAFSIVFLMYVCLFILLNIRWNFRFAVLFEFLLIIIMHQFLAYLSHTIIEPKLLILFSSATLVWLIQIMAFMIKIYFSKFVTEKSYNYKQLNKSIKLRLKKVNSFFNLLNRIYLKIYKLAYREANNFFKPSLYDSFFIKFLKPFYCLLIYFYSTISVIIFYANIYSIKLSSNSESLSNLFQDSFDKYYFSATTFFTVGYGDISPTAPLEKMISVSEMLFSSLINIIFIPLLISIFLSYVIKRVNKNSSLNAESSDSAIKS